jgi:hypothetical protein
MISRFRCRKEAVFFESSVGCDFLLSASSIFLFFLFLASYTWGGANQFTKEKKQSQPSSRGGKREGRAEVDEE